MKKVLLLSIAFILSVGCTSIVKAQGVGINNSGSIPDPSAGLDVNFTNKGTLITRMTASQRDAIASPANGLMIWNISSNCFDVYIVNSWQSIACGCSGPPATPGTITGPTSPCENSIGNVYSITAVSGTLNYIWTVPAGASITAGAGTRSITVAFGPASGNVTVTAGNNCGTSSANSLAISLSSTPATPGAIAGSASFCPNSTGNVYSISAISGATIYTWSVPSDASITGGQNTPSITVTFGTASGNINVTAGNSCGTSLPRTLAVALSSGSQVFTYTGSDQTFTVPSCISSVHVKIWGAGGSAGNQGRNGGGGGYADGNITVTPGEVLTVIVGQGGVTGGGSQTYGGGGAGDGSTRGSGGGRSAIQSGGTELITAGAGGAAGGPDARDGGAGGGSAGQSGTGSSPGGGGTQNAGGTAGGCGGTNAGSLYAGGNGLAGGGSGYYGGGSGGDCGCCAGAGGGGSSYTSNVRLSNAQTFGGSGLTPGNNPDSDRNGAGQGGSSGQNGANGRIILSW